MNRKSRSVGRRSSILKIDANWEDETGIIDSRNRRQSKRVSFAECYQVKEFPRDSPRRWLDDSDDANSNNSNVTGSGITGLDQLLNSEVQTPYKDLVESPNVSPDRFSISLNKTVLDPVNMDMTQVVESMDFMTEPSAEIKFDVSSFLQSLKTKPSDGLTTMQIYSPSRDNQYTDVDEPDPAFLNFQPPTGIDKENVPVHINSSLNKENVPYNHGTAGSLQKGNGDWRDMIQKIFHKVSDSDAENNMEKQLDSEDPFDHMDDTICVGPGIVDVPLINNKQQVPAMNSELNIRDKENHPGDVTRCFGAEDGINFDIDETKCIGGILATQSEVQTMVGIDILKNNDEAQNSDFTTYFSNEDPAGMDVDETRCVGGILNTGDSTHPEPSVNTAPPTSSPGHQLLPADVSSSVKTEPVSRSSCNEYMVDNEVTIVFDKLDQDNEIEETRCVGGIQHDDIAEDVVQNTHTAPINTSVMAIKAPQTSMETAACDTLAKQAQQADPAQDTVNHTVPMEEMIAVNQITNKTVNEELPMEETQALGQIMNQTVNLTLPMEETQAVGQIMNKTVNEALPMEETQALGQIMNQTVNLTVPMEETQAVGQIMNKTLNEALPMEETQAVGQIMNQTVNLTVPMEETQAVGQIMNKTVNEELPMEETRALGQIMNQTVAKAETQALGQIMNKTVNQTVAMKETLPVGQIMNETVNQEIALEGSTSVSGGCRGQITEEDIKCSDADYIDSEISIKVSNKRPFDRNSENVDIPNSDNTQELTKLLKLKQKLLMSQNAGTDVMKTPLKLNTSVMSENKTPLSVRSPLYKRPRFSLEGDTDGLDRVDPTAALLQGYADSFTDMPVTETDTAGLIGGIELEAMPDFMKTDLCMTATSTNARHESHALSTLSDNVFNEPDRVSDLSVATAASQSYNEPHNASIVSSIAGYNSNKSLERHTTSTLSNLSTATSSSTENDMPDVTSMTNLSNRSVSALPTTDLTSASILYEKSFILPDGPLTVESFFNLTKVKFFSGVKQVPRLSTIYLPRLDLDDLSEVVHTNLTLTSLVQAKSKMRSAILQQTQQLEAETESLRQELERKQPEIFQECIAAAPDKLEPIRKKLWPLLESCKELAKTSWLKHKTDMFVDSTQHLKEFGTKNATEVMTELRRDVQSVDELISIQDKEIEELELTGRRLEELEIQQRSLTSEKASNDEKIARLQKEEDRLRLAAQNHTRKCLQDETDLMKRTIKCHLLFSQWNLVRLEEEGAVFRFDKQLVDVCVQFTPGQCGKLIRYIQLNPICNPDKMYFEIEVAQSFIMTAIKPEELLKKYPSAASLPQMLHEVCSCINEVERFCTDMETAHYDHVLHFQNNELSLDLWDKALLDFITVRLTFDPCSPLTSRVQAQVHIKFGEIRACDVEKQLSLVEPGHRYLSRLIQAVNFKQLHTSS